MLFVKPAKRALSCATKVAFVSRASDADRRSRRCGDAARRSLLPKRQRSVRGLLTRPSSSGVAALGPLRPLRGSRAPSCDFASQSSSLRSSGDLTASPQVHLALGQPDAFGAGECLKRLCRASDAPRFVVARQRLLERSWKQLEQLVKTTSFTPRNTRGDSRAPRGFAAR